MSLTRTCYHDEDSGFPTSLDSNRLIAITRLCNIRVLRCFMAVKKRYISDERGKKDKEKLYPCKPSITIYIKVGSNGGIHGLVT